MLRKILKTILFPILKPIYALYLNRPRDYTSRGIRVKVFPGVFHPGLYISTELLLDFLDEKSLQGKRLLELGAGSGMVSLFAAKKGAAVTASDLNKAAVENIRKNAEINQFELTVIYSDLFDQFPPQIFDWMIINPPYYPKNPSSEEEMAFFCGENFEYFHRLFAQIKDFTHQRSYIYMILSEDCDLKKIEEIANSSEIKWVIEEKRQKWGEWNYIIRLVI